MPLLLALIAGALGWALWTGRLRARQLLPILLGISGAFLAVRGNYLLGLGAVGIALVWYHGLTSRLFVHRSKQKDQSAIDKARFLLGVSRFDNEERIRARHRVLIAQSHPDTGGSDERASKLNKARDLLLRDLDTKLR